MDKKTKLQGTLKKGKLDLDFDFSAPGAPYLTGANPAKKETRGRPKTSTKVITPGNTPEDGTLIGERRATYILPIELIDQVESLAYWERMRIKDVVREAFTEYITRYEKKKGTLQPKPKK
jgi:hypothetical protein